MAETGENTLFIDHKSPTKNETSLHNVVHEMAFNAVIQRNNNQTVTEQRNCVQAKSKNESATINRQQFSFVPVKAPSANGEHLCVIWNHFLMLCLTLGPTTTAGEAQQLHVVQSSQRPMILNAPFHPIAFQQSSDIEQPQLLQLASIGYADGQMQGLILPQGFRYVLPAYINVLMC